MSLMDDRWRYNRFRMRRSCCSSAGFVLILCLVLWNLSFCLCLNDEGLSLLKFRDRVSRDPYGALLTWSFDEEDEDPCSWDGIECSDGKVMILNLKDLCLEGTLAPELGNLIHVKAIVLRNNSFYGVVPEELKELKDLEVLDLGFNAPCKIFLSRKWQLVEVQVRYGVLRWTKICEQKCNYD